ncbi:DUF3265 domain-containing protein [Vibrio parahaemolyticus]|nr:DUF3265 domain-containing protein [Vibrio parahaemolyticus]EJG0923746.1 DUF3265 domain-containing protein [Vibrio parahaemolyticus O1:K68]EJG0933412.1 DUF3265 domain-containing protein [Vibrio parahaemolyticus O1]EJG0947520.1 DUF3265 domain-containing protein [Vibrio parahaemolyticus O10]EIK0848150.1 DUF3265 domain-containing protein [Vibrio parahaemolyticus]EJQ8030727.1 DUF3265 domain-containing protein [Vibrio parahaemolyticus]
MSKNTKVKQIHNKQFKRDSARVAFLVCVGFGVEVLCGGLVNACFTP